MQGLIKSTNEPKGIWTDPVEVNAGFADRFKSNPDLIKRKHRECN